MATLVWGLGLVAACAVNCGLVFALTIQQVLLVSAPIGYVALGGLTA